MPSEESDENRLTVTEFFAHELNNNNGNGNGNQVQKDTSSLFDLIIIDESVSAHEYNALLDKILKSIQILSNDGTIIVTNVWPTREIEATQPKTQHAFFWLGDAWKVILDLIAYDDLDIALCDFDW